MDVIIIGGGASGLCAAIGASRCGDRTLILEKNERIGKKLLATGNGRCNLMNLHPGHYGGDSEFAHRVLGEDPVEELTAFWEELGLKIRYDREGRGYPCTFQASTVLDLLRAECRRLGVEILTGQEVSLAEKRPDGFRVLTGNRNFEGVPRMIIATGGAAQPKLGGNLSAWPWLRAFGHQFAEAIPSLTSLITDMKSVSGLAGLRVKCRLSVETDGQKVHQETGELLFTEKGISGICVMQCSRFAVPGHSRCVVDLFPDLFESPEQLLSELIRRRDRNPEGSPPDLLRGLCAPKLAYAVCKQAGLPLRGETSGEVTDYLLQRVASVTKGYSLSVLGKESFERAQVMSGGVLCRDFSPDRLSSSLCPGLHVTGELLNVDGECGGYNLMFAFLSGLRAGVNGRRAG